MDVGQLYHSNSLLLSVVGAVISLYNNHDLLQKERKKCPSIMEANSNSNLEA